MRHTDRDRVGTSDAAPRQQQIESPRWADELGQQARSGRRKYAEFHLRLSERGVRSNEQEMAGECDFHPAAKTLASHGHEDRNRRLDHAKYQFMNALQHCLALIGQVLLDAGAITEMRAFGIDQDRTKAWVVEMIGERSAERAYHDAVRQFVIPLRIGRESAPHLDKIDLASFFS